MVWAVLWVGAVTFTLGHGLHLAANSISNGVVPGGSTSEVIHLWDEVVSHYIWYVGLYLVLAAVALALRAGGLGFGLLWRPAPVARLMRLVGGLGLILLLGWGVYWFVVDGLVFPQFSELGWI